MSFLVTCEHGSDRVPDSLVDTLQAEPTGSGFVCRRGFDVGARSIAGRFALQLGCSLVSAPWSPLVVDCNRPAGHRRAFSAATRQLPLARRKRLLKEVLEPHQQRVGEAVERQISRHGHVIHLAIHTFAPFDPQSADSAVEERCELARRTDLGLLYDPARPLERDLCNDWYLTLYDSLPMLRVRRNYPRRGTRDGLTKSLRKQYPPEHYVGIEVHFNQAWCSRSTQVSRQAVRGVIEGLAVLCGQEQRFAA